VPRLPVARPPSIPVPLLSQPIPRLKRRVRGRCVHRIFARSEPQCSASASRSRAALRWAASRSNGADADLFVGADVVVEGVEGRERIRLRESANTLRASVPESRPTSTQASSVRSRSRRVSAVASSRIGRRVGRLAWSSSVGLTAEAGPRIGVASRRTNSIGP
jgi:hypothetical protein